MEEKIQKWEEEIEKITQRQKEMNAKYTEQIRELRKKIENAKQQLLVQNNEMIADAVRTIYGEVTEENIESFKATMQSLLEQKTGSTPAEEVKPEQQTTGNYFQR